MSATPFDANDTADELPEPSQDASIAKMRLSRCRVVPHGKKREIEVICVHVLLADGKYHWGVLTPHHASQSVEDLITLAVQLGPDYALPVVDAAYRAFIAADVSPELYEGIMTYHLKGGSKLGRQEKPGE